MEAGAQGSGARGRARWSCVAMLLVAGCGGAAAEEVSGPVRVAPVRATEAEAHWTDDFFPARTGGSVEHREWGSHVALIYAGRVYASNGDDMPTQVLAAAFALAFAEPRDEAPRAALIGVGSGVELAVLLQLGASVDLYEPRAELVQNVHHLVGRLGWTVDDLDVTERGLHHPRLRIIDARESAPRQPPRYDVILHGIAVSVYSGAPPLFHVERFERLRDHLAPGGVLGIHQQLYDIRDDVHRRMVATFAAAFPEAIAVVPEDLSSDSLLYGARHPLRIDAGRARELHAGLAGLRAAAPHDPWADPVDLAARVLFSSRDELLRFSDAAPIYRASTGTAMQERDWFIRPPLPDAAEDDAEGLDRWEAAVAEARAELGISETYLAAFYEPVVWHGNPCDDGDCRLLVGFDGSLLVRLAERQIAHGQLARVPDTLQAAVDRGADPALVARATELATLFLRDDRPPVDAAAILDVPASNPAVATFAQGPMAAHRVETLLTALRAQGQPVDDARARLLELMATVAEEGPARELADAVAEDGSLIQAHPEARWYLARAYFHDFLYARAVEWAKAYLAGSP